MNKPTTQGTPKDEPMTANRRHAADDNTETSRITLNRGRPDDTIRDAPGDADTRDDLAPVDLTAVDLDADPFTDDLSERLAAKAPRQIVTRTTAVLVGLMLIAGGFLSGAQVQKHWGARPAAQSGGFPNLGNLGAAGGFPGLGGQDQGSTGTTGPSRTGTVKLVDGTTVYIQTADGSTITIKTNTDTTVQISQAGSLKDLQPGASVTVEGASGSDGTLTATKITKGK
jgi:hypothetical protein